MFPLITDKSAWNGLRSYLDIFKEERSASLERVPFENKISAWESAQSILPAPVALVLRLTGSFFGVTKTVVTAPLAACQAVHGFPGLVKNIKETTNTVGLDITAARAMIPEIKRDIIGTANEQFAKLTEVVKQSQKPITNAAIAATRLLNSVRKAVPQVLSLGTILAGWHIYQRAIERRKISAYIDTGRNYQIMMGIFISTCGAVSFAGEIVYRILKKADIEPVISEQ